jgi:outer membrane protein assembly factor BamB
MRSMEHGRATEPRRVPFDDLLSSPMVCNGVVYVGTESGFFYAHGATDGHIIWDYHATAPIRAEPAIATGVVYFGADDDSLYAGPTRAPRRSWY